MPGQVTALVLQAQKSMDRYLNGENEHDNEPYGGKTGKCQHRGGLLVPMDGFMDPGNPGRHRHKKPECPSISFVNVLRQWRTDSFPAEAGQVMPCGGSLAVLLQFGVARCSQAMDDRGNPPTVERMEHEALVLEDDAERMFAALCHATREAKRQELIEAAVIHPWEPVGPEGGVVTGLITASFQIA